MDQPNLIQRKPMKPYLIVKIGGVVATDTQLLQKLLTDLGQATTYACVLVHGGGKEVTALSERLGYQAEFRSGLRITSPGEMEVVDMVLGGKVNISLVRMAAQLGLKAVGLGGQDGKLFSAKALTVEGAPDCRTGQIVASDPSLVKLLCSEGYLPIIHSTCMAADGQGLNVNADEAAQALAVALEAEVLLYVSDIRGVLKNGQVIARLDEEALENEIDAGVISGGMIPKVRNASEAVSAGCGRVIIGGYQSTGDLSRLLAGESGTTIHDGV